MDTRHEMEMELNRIEWNGYNDLMRLMATARSNGAKRWKYWDRAKEQGERDEEVHFEWNSNEHTNGIKYLLRAKLIDVLQDTHTKKGKVFLISYSNVGMYFTFSALLLLPCQCAAVYALIPFCGISQCPWSNETRANSWMDFISHCVPLCIYVYGCALKHTRTRTRTRTHIDIYIYLYQ